MSVDRATGEAPALQVMPDLDADVRKALRDSIERFGVLIPIAVSQDGQILDGHNRWEIAAELGITCPQTVYEVTSEADALELARTLNMDRRHMERPTRIRLAQQLREQGHALKAIAGALGVHHSTIARDLDEPIDPKVSHPAKPSDPPAQVTGSDGKQQPAKKRRWTTEELSALLQKRQTGATLIELANEYGISDRQVTAKLAEAKLGQAKNTKRSVNVVQEREAKVREMAAAGYTSRQIAKALDLSRPSVVISIAKRIGVEIAADDVVGKTRAHDATRIVSETVISLDGTVMALGLVNFDELDPAQCAEWATSISDSLRALTRFRNQLKEMARDEG